MLTTINGLSLTKLLIIKYFIKFYLLSEKLVKCLNKFLVSLRS